MIKLFLAGAALIAVPAFAQTTPAPQTTPSTTNGVPNTALSTSPTPSDGPRAQQGNSPANNDASAAGGGMQPATPAMDPAAAAAAQAGAPVVAAPSSAPADAMPAPAPMDHYPICKAGQFTGCMEPGNGHGGGTAHHVVRKHRR